MSGRVGDLSPKQEQALQQFKENLKDIWQDNFSDHYLLRWLRARSFDLKKSEKMLRDSLTWRKKYGADEILNWKMPEVIEKYRTGGAFGEDKEGSPIVYDVYGYLDFKGSFHAARKQDMIKFKVWAIEMLYEILKEQTKKHGRTIDQVAYIFDMEHIGVKHLWKPAIDVFTEILAIYEANYPETLKKAYVVNAPKIFPIAYNLVKPFLSEDTKTKIHVLGSNWKERLLQDIEPDQLPVNWGGTARDPDGDPYCRSKVFMGGKIPEKYLNQKDNFVDMSEFTTVTVGRGSTLQLDYEVLEKGCAIRWQFLTEGNDIGFGLFLRTSDGRQKASEMEEILKSERVNSHMIPEEGSYDCEQPGVYVVRFDNTYSWMNTKKLSYLIEVLKSDEENMAHEIHIETTRL